MCGIAGIWTGWPVAGGLARAAEAMASAIRHRGPDSSGVWAEEEAGLALAHRRLAIIDLSEAGAQPMASADGRHVLVYNGEIYNHLELRRVLEAADPSLVWKGHSDTETLLVAISRYGLEGALAKVCGMFALALWDRKERHLTLARDRIGEKPLYYGWSGGRFLFASELKALRALPNFNNAIDPQAVETLLRYAYVPAPLSIYSGIYKLPAGSLLRLASFEEAGACKPVAYWSLPDAFEAAQADPFHGNFDAAVQDMEDVLGEVIASQMLSDVPLGSFLSGGIDSTLVTALMQKTSQRPVRTFSIGFSGSRFDESVAARAVAGHLGTEHTEFHVGDADALDLVPQLPTIYDEPFADSSQIPTVLLSRLTREDVTVAMSGDGGDELFGGYNRYRFAPNLWDRATRFPDAMRRCLPLVTGLGQRLVGGNATVARLAAKAGLPVTTVDRLSTIGNALGGADDFAAFFREIVSIWGNDRLPLIGPLARPSLLDRSGEWPNIEDRQALMMILDAVSYLPDDIMVKVDRASMGASLETRAPFVDLRVMKAAFRLPLAFKTGEGQSKRILRAILENHVPRDLIDRPKQGFAVPIDDWLRGGLRDWASDLLSLEKLSKSGLIDVGAVKKLWQSHLRGHDNAGPRLWTVLMFQSWLEVNR